METKYKSDKMPKYQNTKGPYLFQTKYKVTKFECAEMQMQQNTKTPQYICDKILNDKKQMGQM